MPDSVPDAASRRLLGLLQSEFPMSREPYADLGEKLGITGDEVISRIQKMRSAGIVRQISPVLDARKLGYQSTLVALKVKQNNLARAERFIAAHVGISHGYERGHEFNIWVTLAVPPGGDLKAELKDLSLHTGAEAIFALAAVRVFKLRTNFGADEDGGAETGMQAGNDLAKQAALSPTDRKIINILQQDLPLCHDPFAPLAAGLEMSVPSLLSHCDSLLQRCIMRRYGASINHYNAGYKANAMTCWAVPAGRVELIGRQLAGLTQVSHCYERETNKLWHYNVFAMLHNRSKQACSQVVQKIAADTGISDYLALFSTREFKKTRILYRVQA
jgi:DNA-binding Lrp family transcriptional regulator